MMKTASLIQNISFSDNKPVINVLFETEATKEIRILLKKEQSMKEHKAPFPIVIEIFEGTIELGVEGNKIKLQKGDLISLESNISHDLFGLENSIIRLSLSKLDNAERVKSVAN